MNRRGVRSARRATLRRAGVLGRASLLLTVSAVDASATPVAVAIRADHPDLSHADAEHMTPATLGNALLSPGHPAVAGIDLWPDGLAPPPPPGSPIRLRIGLVFAPSLDRPSGFCVRRSAIVTTARPGAGVADTMERRTDYRLPDEGAEGCAGPRRAFFAPAAADRSRAFAIVRLVAAAALAARRAPPPFPVVVDDQQSRDVARLRADHPEFRSTVAMLPEITDGRTALAALPVTAIGYVGRQLADGDLLPAASPAGPGERWGLMAGGTWAAEVALAGDRIVGMGLRRRIPPPF